MPGIERGALIGLVRTLVNQYRLLDSPTEKEARLIQARDRLTSASTAPVTEDPECLGLLGKIHFLLGREALQRLQYDEAEEHFNRATEVLGRVLKLRPDYDRAAFYLACVNIKRYYHELATNDRGGDPNKTAEFRVQSARLLQEAIARNPRWAEKAFGFYLVGGRPKEVQRRHIWFASVAMNSSLLSARFAQRCVAIPNCQSTH